MSGPRDATVGVNDDVCLIARQCVVEGGRALVYGRNASDGKTKHGDLSDRI